jgi:hypothetical protein
VDGTADAAGVNAPATMPATRTISTKLMISPDGMGNGTLCGWWSIKYNYLDSLPANPQALKQVILAQDKPVNKPSYSSTPINNPCYEPNQDAAVFEAIDTLFYGETEGALIPPKLAAALYGVLHLLPEVRFDTGTDLAGRTGLGFSMILDGYDKQEIVINPTTYAYMGGMSVAIKDYTLTGTDGTHYIKAGQVLGWDALLNLAIVDKRPTPRLAGRPAVQPGPVRRPGVAGTCARTGCPTGLTPASIPRGALFSRSVATVSPGKRRIRHSPEQRRPNASTCRPTRSEEFRRVDRK